MINRVIPSLIVIALGALSFAACRTENPQNTQPVIGTKSASTKTLATFGSGCFWCGEAIFEQLRGVEKVVSGFSGGHVESPTYEQICGKQTGHAEVFQVTFDPSVISYTELLEIFWKTHDPTTINRQGNDRGPQYRSVIFHHSDTQRKLAESFKRRLEQSNAFDSPIVTEISPFRKLWPADASHQDYYRRNARSGYCQAVIVPKLLKFQSAFPKKLAR